MDISKSVCIPSSSLDVQLSRTDDLRNTIAIETQGTLVVEVVSGVPLSEGHSGVAASDESSGSLETGKSATSKENVGVQRRDDISGATAKNSVIRLEEPIGFPGSVVGSVLETVPGSGDQLEHQEIQVLLESIGGLLELRLELDLIQKGSTGSENILESQWIQGLGGVDESDGALEFGQQMESH
ncbi:hypothetical protein NDU88_003347 [Pleurodeles waltl]|uniref:Uncharacterized protein n=1 Tax=Pleurodeles waltl TaxID=8319 RepID=A0AAV7LIK6_PLEWA|nr:hypothetical protein NDU88_003347 [Pleurodeles waltl]